MGNLNEEMSLLEAYEKGLLNDVEMSSKSTSTNGHFNGGMSCGPFECISLWEAIERKQLDTQTGMFYSIHEEKKTMSIEEAIYRRYIDKKSALVKDTWKRQYVSLSEAS